jgi:hypothetical protein
MSIDAKWSQFLSSQHNVFSSPLLSRTVTTANTNDVAKDVTRDVHNDIDKLLEIAAVEEDNIEIDENNIVSVNATPPECGELYISTKTKVVYLNQDIDINKVFWSIPVLDYWVPAEGVIKKQMKVTSNSIEEFEAYKEKLTGVSYYREKVIKQIDNPTSHRIRFKDKRKITIGIAKKDIMNYRGKTKGAFNNCFAIMIRFLYEDIYREIHVKVFNTGKLEIPGVINIQLLNIVKRMIVEIFQKLVDKPLDFIENKSDGGGLINSNFNCGFYINRERIHSIITKKYKIEASFDPCSYPGVKCKYYYNNDITDPALQTGKVCDEDNSMKMSELNNNFKYTDVSFMIFRTGSCLVVGNCTEKILIHVFEYVRKLIYDEYHHVCVANVNTDVKVKKPKQRKKIIYVSREQLNAKSL